MNGLKNAHYEHIRVESKDHVAVVTLDRPPVNAINHQTYREILDAFTRLGADDDCRVIVLTSASDRIFSGGADIKAPAGVDVGEDERRHESARLAFNAVRNCRKPVIAALTGIAVGSGAVFAACADIRIAAEGAAIGLPEVKAGRAGGGRHMMRIIPQTYLRWMYFTGEPLPADVAHRLGAVVDVVSGDRATFDAAVLELAHTIAALSPEAIQLGKEALNLAEMLPTEAGYAVEQQFTHRLLAEKR